MKALPRAKLYLESKLSIINSLTFSVPNDEIICNKREPEGLHIFENFISESEENEFLNIFDTMSNEESSLKNRQVKHYGYEFRYGSNDVDLTSPLTEKIPAMCDFLWPRLKMCGIDIPSKPDQLTVNKYRPGQGNSLIYLYVLKFNS